MRSRVLISFLLGASLIGGPVSQSLATDTLRLLASVSHLQADSDDCTMASIEGECKKPEPPPPPPPKKGKKSALSQSAGGTFNNSIGSIVLGF